MRSPLIAWCVLLVLAVAFGQAPAGAGSKEAPKFVVVAGRPLAGEAPVGGELKEPFGVEGDREGNLYIVELGGGRVHRLAPDGKFSTFAGTGEKGDAGDGGRAAKAVFNGMHNLSVGPTGDLFLADTWNQKVRRIDAKTGSVSTIVGTGKKGFSGDGGDAAKADCGGLYCVALEPGGKRMFLADLDNRRIRVVTLVDGDTPRGTITTLAGNGQRGVPKNGMLATQSPLVDPRAVACDSKGNVYILERSGHALRVVDPGGPIYTVAGTGKSGPAQDDAPALEATLNGPKHLCVDSNDDVIIADAENNVIRKFIVKEKRVVRLAGTGKPGTGKLGNSLKESELARPHGVWVDPKGTL